MCVYCETFKNKEFVATTLSQNSPMLAGVILALPPCQRIQATVKLCPFNNVNH